MSEKHTKICTTLNYIEYFCLVASAVNGYIPIFVFASLVDIYKNYENWKRIKDLCNNFGK